MDIKLENNKDNYPKDVYQKLIDSHRRDEKESVEQWAERISIQLADLREN